jgi:orotidine-5'-phosphate decarboxylase
MGKPFLFVALDDLYRKEGQTLEIATKLCEVQEPFGFKINLDYLLRKSIPVAVRMLRPFGRPIFADLKMWNGARTMTDVIEQLVEARVDYFNVYSLADSQLPRALQVAKGTQTKSLGVTILTHYEDGYCLENFGRPLTTTVTQMSLKAIEKGCDGVIVPGTTLKDIKHLNTIKCVSGIRMSWYPDDSRHEQAVEAMVAIEEGATLLVCGGPIMKAKERVGIEPTEALKRILIKMGV